MTFGVDYFNLSHQQKTLTRMFHELLWPDHATGNPLVADTACGAGLSGAKRARRRWACLPAMRARPAFA